MQISIEEVGERLMITILEMFFDNSIIDFPWVKIFTEN